MTTDIFLSDFSDTRFQAAFRLYFEELGIQVRNWDGLWDDMNHDKNAENRAYLRLTADGSVVGFIQFCSLSMKSWFFEEQHGFIREFWVHPSHRGRGHGHALLALAEDHFRKQGIAKCLLTTDTAASFYQKHGYHPEQSIVARNKEEVWGKSL